MARARRAAASLVGLTVLLLFAPPAHAQLSVEEIAIAAGLAVDEAPAWFFIIEVQGTELVSGAVTPPLGNPIALTDASGGGFELEFEGGPFTSFGDLQQAHPPGDYRFTINGSHAVTLVWNPIEPVGASGQPSLTIDSPADGAAGVSSTPDVFFSVDCANCNDMRVELQSLPGPTFDFGELDVGSFTNPIPFAAMMSTGGETELADGLVDAQLLVGLVDFADRSFDPPSGLAPFSYVEAAAVFAFSTFTVPEPGATTALLTALVALGWLGRRDRAGTR